MRTGFHLVNMSSVLTENYKLRSSTEGGLDYGNVCHVQFLLVAYPC